MDAHRLDIIIATVHRIIIGVRETGKHLLYGPRADAKGRGPSKSTR